MERGPALRSWSLGALWHIWQEDEGRTWPWPAAPCSGGVVGLKERPKSLPLQGELEQIIFCFLWASWGIRMRLTQQMFWTGGIWSTWEAGHWIQKPSQPGASLSWGSHQTKDFLAAKYLIYKIKFIYGMKLFHSQYSLVWCIFSVISIFKIF